jgi:hypothetical protein
MKLLIKQKSNFLIKINLLILFKCCYSVSSHYSTTNLNYYLISLINSHFLVLSLYCFYPKRLIQTYYSHSSVSLKPYKQLSIILSSHFVTRSSLSFSYQHLLSSHKLHSTLKSVLLIVTLCC